MKTSTIAILAVALLGWAGCDDALTVPDHNNPSLEELEGDPTASAVQTAATGLLVGTRVEAGDRNGYVSLLGILGRESYNFDGSDPRFITEMLEGRLDPGSPAFGGNLWNDRYRNIRNANVVLNAVDEVEEFSDGEKQAIRGFAKTIQALDLLKVMNTRDANGAVIDVDRDPTEPPGPIVSKQEVFDRIVALLDEARTHLESATSFPFALSTGFTGFDSPDTFIEFNRALMARVKAYMASMAMNGAGIAGTPSTLYEEALAALDESFLVVDAAELGLGVYHTFGTGSGDSPNALYDPGEAPDILAHPSIVTDAEAKPNGEPDDRVQAKIRSVDAQTQRGISTASAFAIYDGPSAPIPMIRNEDLILLRAEARLFTGDAAGAAADINFIRENSGGLAPIADLADRTEDEILDELLTQRRYSLLFEGGHRWIDLRRHDRLGDPDLLDDGSHRMNVAFPVPEAECLAQESGC